MLSVFILLAVAFVPQSPAPPVSQQPGGVAAPWDVRGMLDVLQTDVQRLRPLLDQMNPDEWVRRGAPDSYVEQWKNLKTEMGYFQISAQSMAKHPEKLSLVLDTFFRLEHLQRQLGSLIEGVRKYHNPAVADAMQAFVDEGSRGRDQMRQYTLDLAKDKEHEYEVMDSEAQRCRAMISRQPASGRK